MEVDKPLEDIFDPIRIFTKKELCYYKMIDKFFRQCCNKNLTDMYDIVEGTSQISLRILDWFVTKYTKRGLDFTRTNGETFDVHINYKAQLKSYKKKYFDPFRRKTKFDYIYKIDGVEKILHTTIGQLNFFRWAITNGIIEFVEKYLNQIIKAMNIANKEEKKRKETENIDEIDSSDNDSSEEESENQESENQESVNQESVNQESVNQESENQESKNQESVNQESENQKLKIPQKKPTIVKSKNKQKNCINVSAKKKIKDDEIELVLCFD